MNDILEGGHANSVVVVDTYVTASAVKLATLETPVAFGLIIILCQTKMNGIYHVSLPAYLNQEIFQLDIAVDERLGMYVFNSRNKLIG